MEKLVHGTGAAVAHAIESEIFRVRMDIEPSSQLVPEDGVERAPPMLPPVDLRRLRQLTAGSMILSCLWEARTYLRRLYGLRREKGKAASKDLAKAPLKAPGVSGDKFWEESASVMAALSSQERMTEQCRAFVELLNVDKELKVAEEEGETGPATPSADEGDSSPERAGSGNKRKAAGTPGGRKKRARQGRPKKSQPASNEDADGEFEEGDWF